MTLMPVTKRTLVHSLPSIEEVKRTGIVEQLFMYNQEIR